MTTTHPAPPAKPSHFASELIAQYALDTGARAVKLFRNGANEAVIRREGGKLIIEPAKPQYEKGSAAALLAALDEMAKLEPIDEEFPNVDEGLLPLDDIDFGVAPQ